MKRLIVLLLIATACSGCGVFRKVFKLNESHKVEITQERKSDSVGVKVDRSSTTITERLDTTITTPAKTVIQETPFNMDSLVNGMTAIKNDLIDVRLHLNPITGTLSAIATVKPQSVIAKLDKVTTKANDITEQSHKQEAIINKTKTEDKHSEVQKDPVNFPVWLATIIVVILILGSILYWRSKVK